MGPFLKQALVILPLLGTSVWLALNSYQDLIGFLGITFSLILCSWFISSVFSFLWNSILAPAMGLGVDFRKMGKWALVTGATDGIGLAYSKQLAEMGLNIVLISRTKDRLESVARQIETMYRVKTKVIQVDFSQHMEHYEKRLQNELSGLDIGTVINNVGMTYERPCYFHEVASNPNFVTSIINLNVVAFTSVTRLLLPEMLQRGKGVFVNVGTVASVTGFPFFALYAATKSYMQQLTLDLALEYADKNIIFQYQNPGYVATKIAKIRNPSFFTPSPEQYAKAGLRSVGLQQSTCVWPPQRLAIGVLNIGLRVYGKDFVREGLHSLLYTFWLFAKKREIEKKKLVINTV